MKAFTVTVRRQAVDEKNLIKNVRSKLLIRATGPEGAIYEASQWAADITEKGKDFEVLSCTGGTAREIIKEERTGEVNHFEIAAEYKSDSPTKKGKRVTIVIVSDTVAHAANKAEVYLGERQPCKVVSCKISSYEAFLGFDE